MVVHYLILFAQFLCLVFASNQHNEYFTRAVEAHRSGKLETAFKLYTNAISVAGKYSPASYHHNRAGVLYSLGKTMDALAGFEDALAISPDHAGSKKNAIAIRFQLATFFESNKDSLEQAEQNLSRIISLAGNETKLFDIANTLGKLGSIQRSLEKIEEAVDSFDRGLSLTPHNSLLWYNRGYALQQLLQKIINDKTFSHSGKYSSTSLPSLYLLVLESYDNAVTYDKNVR